MNEKSTNDFSSISRLSNSTGKHESCFMYDMNYTAAAEAGYDDVMAKWGSFIGDSNDTIKCELRDFNLTQYKSTVVTEVRCQLLSCSNDL